MLRADPNFWNADEQKANFAQNDSLFEDQYNLFTYLTKRFGSPPVLIDADRLVANPASSLQLYCQATGIVYTDNLLAWESLDAATQPPNFVVPQSYVTEYFQDWFFNAWTSTSFRKKPKKQKSLTQGSFHPSFEEVVAKETVFYDRMMEFVINWSMNTTYVYEMLTYDCNDQLGLINN